jgi:hypothetical protein
VSTTDMIRANRPTTDQLKPIPAEVAERFPVLDPAQQAEMMELLAENLDDGEALSISNLTKVGNPQGKVLAFMVPDGNGGQQPVKEITGIVLGWQSGRTLYLSTDVSDSPPDCSSRDDEHGFGLYGKGSEGNPSGLCSECPMGQWQRTGEGEKDVPPPCKPMVNMLLLTEDEALPYLVRVPRTSMKAFELYRKGLIRQMTGLARSTVKISLVKAVNEQGTEYGEFVFTLGDKLPGGKDVAAAALAFGEEMKKVIEAPNARERDAAKAISASAERVSIGNAEGGVDFGAPTGAPVDEVADDEDDGYGPTADELADLDTDANAETSTTGAR